MPPEKTIEYCLGLLLLAALLSAGCSGPSSTGENTTSAATRPATTVTEAGGTPIYSAGDVVQMPGSDASSAWLVTGYDKKSDRYERALLLREGGTWYRTDSSSESISRVSMEKVYTQKLTSIDVSTLEIRSPVTIAPASTAAPAAGEGEEDNNSFETSTATATATPAGSLKVMGITPDTGNTNSVVTITDIKGMNFQSGATVKLTLAGEDSIDVTDVNLVSSSHMTGKLTIPKDASVGTYSVVVTNPDGQSAKYANIFTIHKGSDVGSADNEYDPNRITITSVFPSSVKRDSSVRVKNLAGTNFQPGATVTLKRSGEDDIEATDVIVDSSVKITCVISAPLSVTAGPWDLVVENPDGTSATLVGGFAVMS